MHQNKMYRMKRSLLSIFFLLTVVLAAVAQPRISSNKETHNFGQIEWKRPVTVEYTITNTGNQPLVLYQCHHFLCLLRSRLDEGADCSGSERNGKGFF